VGQLLDEAEHRIFEVSQERTGDGFTRIKELLWPTMERIEALQRGGKTITGVPSGFSDLDDLTSGFQPSDLVIVAARPSMGKTAIVLNIAQHAAIEANVPCAIFSLEMSKESLVQRLLTAEGRVDAQRLRKGMLHNDDFPRLARAAGILSTAPIWIDDTPGITLLEIRSKARRLKADNNIGMVIVDYLQLIQGPTDSESRQQEISQISRSLKALAKELKVPVVALSQLSRAPEQRSGDHRPQLSDLRESGAIEQDADLVMFVYRQEMYDGPTDKDGNSIEGRAEVIIGKQRNGPTGVVNLFFHKAYTRFESYSPRQSAQ
jgi:replicative DNA helicase